MKPPRRTSRKSAASRRTTAKSMSTSASRRASIFRNGANQAVRLPQELRFPENVKEVRIEKQGDSLLISPVRPNWASFFARKVKVPEDFLEPRGDTPPQEREPL
jgi:antitoxin VapB